MGTKIVEYQETEHAVVAAVTEAQRLVLMQRTPLKEIKLRKGKGGKQFKYVEHSYVTETLNLAFGWNWDFQVAHHEQLSGEVYVLGRLTVRTPYGAIVKEQFGSSDVKMTKTGEAISIGDDFKAAASDALKKTASLLGIALDLYGRESGKNDNGPVTDKAIGMYAELKTRSDSLGIIAPLEHADEAANVGELREAYKTLKELVDAAEAEIPH